MTQLDAGTGYGRKSGTSNLDLTLVGPRTPMGELMRRYWHPVGLSEDASATPRQVRILGEDLVLFRDRQGLPGLVVERCCHRGASLYYGKVEETGLRCAYHGWLFDVQGNCLDQQCEPNGGLARSKARQPWYPLQERYGLVFAYMGPPAKKSVLPRFAALENLTEGEQLITDDNSLGGGGPQILPFNWLQHVENIVDPAHIEVLHESHSGPQFSNQVYGPLGKTEFERTPYGVRFEALRNLPGGLTETLGAEIANITLRIVPTARLQPTKEMPIVGVGAIGWTVPIDDTNFRIYVAIRVREKPKDLKKFGDRRGEKFWSELTLDERRALPGDFETQSSQGPIALHSEEHLATSDRGVVMFRRLLREQIDIVAKGGDPIGVSFDPDTPPIQFQSVKKLVLTKPRISQLA